MRTALRQLLSVVDRRGTEDLAQELRGAQGSAAVEMQRTIGPLLDILMSSVVSCRRWLLVDGAVGYASWYAFPAYSARHFVPATTRAISVRVRNRAGSSDRESKESGSARWRRASVCRTEMATAVPSLNLVAIVFNNHSYGNVKRDQIEKFGGRVIGSDLTNPDFVKLAESFGAAGYRCETPAQLATALKDAFDQRGPALIEMPLGEMPNPCSTSPRLDAGELSESYAIFTPGRKRSCRIVML